jgi:hypothetical protein
MTTDKELDERLLQLTAANDDARKLISEMRGEQKNLLELRKSIRADIKHAVDVEVTARVAEVEKAARDEMTGLMVDVVGKLEHDWREKLGI